jgi:DNA-binding winged helix-turn-helix (wHTH) protein
MTTSTDAEPALYRENPLPNNANQSSWATAEVRLEFGRFQVLLRRRQMIADAAPIELGTRAFDILLVLLEADGSLVTKDELLSRVWPGIVVAEENLKVQISALRRALGKDRDFVRTEFGRGYRFTAAVRSTVAGSDCRCPMRRQPRSSQRMLFQWISRRPPQGGHAGRRFDPPHIQRAALCRVWIASAMRKGEET